MLAISDEKLIEQGLRAGETALCHKVKTWARHSNEKADVAAVQMDIVRQLDRDHPAPRPLRALSIGCSSEPQFRLLEAAYRGGLYLYDADGAALKGLRARINRQMINGVVPVQGNYLRDFRSAPAARAALAERLGGEPFDLINLHHSLYYCDQRDWTPLVTNLYQELLAPLGRMHIVMMSAADQREGTTTWLYNLFAERFFNHRNDQDLGRLRDELADSPAFAGARFSYQSRDVRFRAEDFETFMAAIWLILLYPEGHAFSLAQRREITEFVLAYFWRENKPIIQVQDNLVISKD